MVNVYDRERCICNLIRDKDQVDMQLYSQATKDYFKSKPNHRTLLKYSRVFDLKGKNKSLYGGAMMKTPEQQKGSMDSWILYILSGGDAM